MRWVEMTNNRRSEEEVLQLFRDTGVLLDGHFRLTSGKHSPQFLQCAQVLRFPQYTEELAAMMADPFRNAEVDKVVGPAMGGIILSYEVARQLGTESIYTEKSDGGSQFRRGFSVEPGERVLVVEDAITTGGTVNSTIEICAQTGAELVGVSVLVDRSGRAVDFAVPYRAVVTVEIPAYSPAECPLCRDGVELVSPKDLGM